MKRNDPARQIAIRLRRDERLSNDEIWKRLNRLVDKSTITRWLSAVPLTKSERSAKVSTKMSARNAPFRKKRDCLPSKYMEMASQGLSTQQKGKVAQSAIVFRLSLLGHNVFISPFDGDVVDLMVQAKNGVLLKIQVRTCRRGSYGSPFVKLTCTGANRKTRRFKQGDFDFIVGYDLRSDCAWVFSWDETSRLGHTVSVRDDAMEAWHKLGTARSRSSVSRAPVR